MTRAIYDFETKPISDRPRYPPEPVGLALVVPGQPKTYYSWGHKSENGVFELRGAKLARKDGDAKALATRALRDAIRSYDMLGHNSSKFDADVMETHLGVKPPGWDCHDDSLFCRFLVDPHAVTLSLKASLEAVLGRKPEERDAVFEWLARAGIIPKAKGGKYKKDAGAHIWEAPGSLVARYAIQDCDGSGELFDHDMKIIKHHGMEAAYDRERRVAPILLANERQGMRVDMPLLEHDLVLYQNALEKVEAWLRKKLGAPTSINWDADAEVALYLRKSGVVKIFPKTPTGKESVSKNKLTAEFYSDRNVYRALVYRNIVAYVLSQNIDPWHQTASQSGGRIFTQWQQVRSDSVWGGGARSGRVTCAKWANIIKDPTGGKNVDYLVADDEAIRKLINLPELPLARKYCLPDEGEQFGHVDWNQQEIRLTANWEEAELAAAYRKDPAVDIHQFATDLINNTSGQKYKRAVIKHVNLRQFYGGGREGLVTHPMLRLDKVYKCRAGCMHKESQCPAYKAAGDVVRDWRAGLPGVVRLTKSLSSMYKRGEAIRTLGGRLYNCKPPGIAKTGINKGRMVTYEYTGLNYLIQPSGADALKMALIAYDEHPKREARLLNTVYDEINISAHPKKMDRQLALLKEVMMGIKIDVPWRVDADKRERWGGEKL